MTQHRARTGRLLPLVLAAPLLMACAGAPGPATPPLAGGPAPQRYLLADMLPPLGVDDAAARQDAAAIVARVAQAGPGGRGEALSPEFVPLLFNAPEGRDFLGLTEPKVLVTGTPARQCPALVPGAGPTLGAALEDGAQACRDALRAAEAPESCGCRLLAADHVLTGDRADYAYARGIPARQTLDGSLSPLRLVAEQQGAHALVLYAGSRAIWEVGEPEAGRATLRALAVDGPVSAGTRIEASRRRVGLDRGRYAERIDAHLPDGRSLTLLIGQ
ncbi:hypothetical protein [Oceanicella sp. SM1341]|uniref:hypothetical protein n=1 Tax=Oceanicella sp. SM1341 TaxID=1548889 RepID=UPI000E556C38|nr:hypothetical protein [Oceanicella sp. SM1341]